MILEVDDLVKTFGGITATNHVSFDIEAEPITGVIGPNGAGKTTLFNCITGFYEPDSGSIRFRGEEISGLPAHKIAKKGIGRTFQISRPFGEMTVRENLEVSNYDLPRERRQERVAEVMDVLALDHQANTLAENLSGGQQTLLEIGRVLMLDPDVILLDEPAAGVNPKLVDRIANLIQDLNDEHTFIIIEHDITLISRLCDRVMVLNEGEIIADGPMEEVSQDPAVRTAYLGE